MEPLGSLAGVRIKLARADAHIVELRERLEPFVRAATDSIGRESDGETKLIYRARYVPDVDPAISAIAGDALFNMRSALDHLAYQLVMLDGRQPDRYSYFPIHGDPLNKNGNPRVVTISPGLFNRADIRTELEEVQPYNELGRGRSPSDSSLWLVNDLCNLDKHRLLIALTHTIDRYEPGWWGLVEGVEVTKATYRIVPIASGDSVGEFTFNRRAPADFDPHRTLGVTLDDVPVGHWSRLMSAPDLLAALRRGVAVDINRHFRNFFGPNEPLVATGPYTTG
jgi:hypothetical protein